MNIPKRNNSIKNLAIKDHYLSSIVPFQTISHPKQFLKTKQFYKPEQFIWNNRHRTSKRMYPHYHLYNQAYEKYVQPHVEELVQNDRELNQHSRIKKLTDFRNQTRKRFHSRQQMRHKLEEQSDSRKRQHSNKTQLHNYYGGELQKSVTSGLKLAPSSNMSYKYTQNKIQAQTHMLKPNHLSITQQSYKMGTIQFDQNMEKIKKIFAEQLLSNQSKIRSQFKARKKFNQLINSRIKHRAQN